MPHVGRCNKLKTPLMGTTGMMKKSVMKRIPLLEMKFATVPHEPQRIAAGAGSDPHEKKCVPIIKKNETTSFV